MSREYEPYLHLQRLSSMSLFKCLCRKTGSLWFLALKQLRYFHKAWYKNKKH